MQWQHLDFYEWFKRVLEGREKLFSFDLAVIAGAGILLQFLNLVQKKTVVIVLAFFVIGFSGMEYLENWHAEFADHNYGIDKIRDYDKTMSELTEKLCSEDESWFRMEKTATRFGSWNNSECNSEAMSYGFDGIAHYSSARIVDLAKLFTKLGTSGDETVISYDPVVLTDMLFNVKYVVSGGQLPGYSVKETVSEKNLMIYQNDYATGGIGYLMAEPQPISMNSSDCFFNQSMLFESLAGREAAAGLYSECEITDTSTDGQTYTEYTIRAACDGLMYVMLENGPQGTVISANGNRISNNIWYNNMLRCLGEFREGDPVILRVENSLYFDNHNPHVAVLNMQKLEEISGILKDNAVKVKEIKNGYLSGEITADRAGIVMMTVPYENGWRVKVNGDAVPYEKIAGALISFDVPEGINVIEMEYHTPYLGFGIVLTGAALVVWLIWEMLKNKKQ